MWGRNLAIEKFIWKIGHKMLNDNGQEIREPEELIFGASFNYDFIFVEENFATETSENVHKSRREKLNRKLFFIVDL